MMHTGFVALILATALLHGSLIAFLVVGGPLCVGRPGLVKVHVLTAVAVGAVFVAGAPCPLTVVEDWARARAGWAHGGGVGFVSRYLLHPVGLRPSAATTVAIVLVWTLPTVIGHTLAWRRRSARPVAVG